jgi:hypothetical protein
MEMIGHHRESKHIDTENPCQKLEPIPHPLPPMLVVLPGEFIDSTQKPTPHAPIDAMHNLNFPRRQNLTPIDSCHDFFPIRLSLLDGT